MRRISILEQELRKTANELFKGDLDTPLVREKVLTHEVLKKFGARGQSVVDSFLEAKTPHLNPRLSHKDIAVDSVAGLESIVALHLRTSGG